MPKEKGMKKGVIKLYQTPLKIDYPFFLQKSRKGIKKIWVKKEPGNGIFPGFFDDLLVSINAC